MKDPYSAGPSAQVPPSPSMRLANSRAFFSMPSCMPFLHAFLHAFLLAFLQDLLFKVRNGRCHVLHTSLLNDLRQSAVVPQVSSEQV